MSAVMKYDADTVKKAVKLGREIGAQQAGKKMGIDPANIRRWMERGDGYRSPSKTELLREMAELLVRYGPELSNAQYEVHASHPASYKRHWTHYLKFRMEAWSHVPYAPEYTRRTYLEVDDALMIIGSDAHYWPFWGASTAHRALVYFCETLKPTHVIYNGDVPDFPQISRHGKQGWKKMPTLKDELDEVKKRVKEVERVSMGAEHLWNWGNHCMRFDYRLADKNPEFEDIEGTRLPHHFLKWKFQMAIRVNEDQLEIKHRFRGGEYAPKNNTLKAGISYVSGHDHSSKIIPWRDLRGQRWGINPGMMADPWGPQFEYAELNPADHQSGLAVVTFRKGKLMPPELVETVEPGVVWFRGARYEV